MTLTPDSVLQGLTQPQRVAATTIDGPLLVLAGAGSGKTRTITRRVAYMVACGIPAWNILAITFTNKAAGEMRQRILQILGGAESRLSRGVTVATFHSLCARLLRQYADQAGLAKNFSILDTADQLRLIKQAMKDIAVSADNFPASSILNNISSAKNKLQTPSAYSANAGGFFEKNVARVYARYEHLLSENHGVDFDDLLLKTALLLRDNQQVRTELQDRFQYVLIDEYQDTNHAQFTIAHMLCMNHKNMCATGDPDQSIYGWRGANLNNILEFEQFYSNAKVVLLEQNYRSTKTILKAASALIARNTKRKKKDLWTENETGPKIQILVANDEHQEAAELIKRIAETRQRENLNWDQFAIFYRVNSLSRVLEDALMKAAIPYQIARGTEFYSRKEIKDITSYLKVVANPADNVSLERIINVPPRGLGDTSLTRLSTYAADNRMTVLEACVVADQVEGLTTRAVNSCKKLAALFNEFSARAFPDAAAATAAAPLQTIPPDDITEQADAAAAAESTPFDPLFDLSLDQAVAESEEYVPGADDLASETSMDQADSSAAFDPSSSQSPAAAQPAFTIRYILDRVYRESGLEADLRKKEDDPDSDRAANVEEFINVAAEFDNQNPGGTLDDFLAQVTLASDTDRLKDAGGAVTLMTLHAAKGLEFPWVAIAGMEDGLIPHSRALNEMTGGDDMEEERRLAFVGITRAMKFLTLSNARYRMVRGETLRTVASQFLREMPEDCFEEIDLAGGEGPGSLSYRDEAGYAQQAQVERARQAAAQRSEATDLAGQFRRGMLVRHLKFGLGRIEEITASGANTRCVVQFTGAAGRKILILQYANLERVDS